VTRMVSSIEQLLIFWENLADFPILDRNPLTVPDFESPVYVYFGANFTDKPALNEGYQTTTLTFSSYSL